MKLPVNPGERGNTKYILNQHQTRRCIGYYLDMEPTKDEDSKQLHKIIQSGKGLQSHSVFFLLVWV